MSRCVYDQITSPGPRRRKQPFLLGALAVCILLVTIPILSRPPAEAMPPADPTPAPTPTPSPTPTPLDFSQPLPEREAADVSYFADALFIGDSRTDGLRLYSGVEGATFYSHTGLTIFGVGSPDLVTVNGEGCSILEALERGPQFGKIYIAFGMNELGYYNEEYYLDTFGAFLDQVKALQPNAIVYLQNLAPVDEAKCARYGQASCITNARVAVFNGLFARLARERRVALVDVNSDLAEADGGLPDEATSDGIHLTRTWCRRWLDCLRRHTADPEAYWAAQAAGQE